MKTFGVWSATIAAMLWALGLSAQQDVLTKSTELGITAPGASLSSIIVPGHNFDGLGQNSFGFIDPFIPPDPAGAVGTTQYVEWVNTSLAVFNKGTGEIVTGLIPGNTIWSSMGDPCATYNSGQPVVQFDKLANRWVIGQLVLTGPPYYFCVAVSETDDATGNFYLYAIQLNDLPDSPRLGVWPDAYYVTFNMYSGSSFLYANVCALDRSSMLNGQPPRGPVCKQTSSTQPNLLPADLDGTMPPPSGSPNFLLSLGSNVLNFWTFHVDFVNQGNSQLNGPTPITVQSFSPTCAIPNLCIQQEGTAQLLTALSDRLMYRAAYRNFGDHESLVVNHTIIFALKTAAIRWYELRKLSSLHPTVFQEGTQVGTDHRWMGNLAMDSMGDIVAGYNVSSKTKHPLLSFAARVPGQTPGQLGAENLAMQGTGSQTSGSAWGNSTSLSVDPVDDCTFWFAGEYLRADGAQNWNTRISSFTLNTCPSTNPGIQITSSPDYGTDDRPLAGTVSNINPADYGNYKVGVLLFISGVGWWSKPYCNELFVPISNGMWSADVGTGGGGSEDYSAVKYVAYLLPQSATGTCQMGVDGLPPDLEKQAVARAYLDRPNPGRRHIVFAGLNWDVTANTFGPINPGPCIFSDSNNNVFVDNSGNLHLKIVNTGGTWTCSEIVPRVNDQLQQEQSYAYGTYTYYLASAVDNLDPNAVVGLFTWSNDPVYAGSFSPWENNPQGGVGGHSELDVEFSKWGNPGNPDNAQFCVQPYTSNPCSQFVMPPGYNNSTVIINWLPDGISFQVQDSNGNILASYNYPGVVPPPADNGGWLGLFPSPQQARLNLWLFGGNPPQNGVEVVVSGFTYVPYSH